MWNSMRSKAYSWFSTLTLTFVFSLLLITGNFLITKSLASIPTTQAWLLGSMPDPEPSKLQRHLEREDKQFEYQIFHQHVVAQQVEIHEE